MLNPYPLLHARSHQHSCKTNGTLCYMEVNDAKTGLFLRIYHQRDGVCCVVESLDGEGRVICWWQHDLQADKTWLPTINGAPVDRGESLKDVVARLQEAARAIPKAEAPKPAPAAAEGDATTNGDAKAAIPTTEKKEKPQPAPAPALASFFSYPYDPWDPTDERAAECEAAGILPPMLTTAAVVAAAAPTEAGAAAEGDGVDEEDALLGLV